MIWNLAANNQPKTHRYDQPKTHRYDQPKTHHRNLLVQPTFKTKIVSVSDVSLIEKLNLSASGFYQSIQHPIC